MKGNEKKNREWRRKKTASLFSFAATFFSLSTIYDEKPMNE
jgi:hypothetical protein